MVQNTSYKVHIWSRRLKIWRHVLKIEVGSYLKNNLNIDLINIMIATYNGYLMLTKTKDKVMVWFSVSTDTRYKVLFPCPIKRQTIWQKLVVTFNGITRVQITQIGKCESPISFPPMEFDRQASLSSSLAYKYPMKCHWRLRENIGNIAFTLNCISLYFTKYSCSFA